MYPSHTIKRLRDIRAKTRIDFRIQRLAMGNPGDVKPVGYRFVVFFRSEERTFFEYAFAKSDRDNIDQGELRGFKDRAKDSFALTDEQIRDRIRRGTLIEVFEED